MFDTEGATIGTLFVSTNDDIFIVTETFFKNKQYQNKDIIVAYTGPHSHKSQWPW